VRDPDDTRQVRARCACGWETVGDVESTVAATIDHGQRIHNMAATREDVLAGAEWLEPVRKDMPA